MKNVTIIQDRFKPFGYQLSQEINGLTFKSRSIHSIKEIKKKGFNIVERKDWISGKGYVNIPIDTDKEIDLLANYQLLPLDVQNILHSYDENKDSYKECERISEALKPHGYTVDYDLSGTLFDLKKAETKTFLIMHEHRHGVSNYLVNSNIDLTGYIEEEPSEEIEKVIEALAIDFEGDRQDEFLDIQEFEINNIPTVIQ